MTTRELALEAIHAPATQIKTRCEIWEFNAVDHNDPGYETLWEADVPVVDGTVNVSLDRNERRTIDITFDNTDGLFNIAPESFWYDKVIAPYCGVMTSAGLYEEPMGRFIMDKPTQSHFPHLLKVTGRDYTKKCLTSRWIHTKTFFSGSPISTLVYHITSNCRIPDAKVVLPTSWETGTHDRRWTFERDEVRWESLKRFAQKYGRTVFFDRSGYLHFRKPRDVTTAPVNHALTIGAGGNLITVDKSVDDSRIHNDILVVGQKANNLPAWGRAQNVDPLSPTNLLEIGNRVRVINAPEFETNAECQTYAEDVLAISSLEQFEIGFGALKIPWVSVDEVLTIQDPSPWPGDPDRFYLTDVTIPLGLGAMSGTARRLIAVG